MVVPDQRSVPLIAGWMRRNGAVTGSGIRPSLTIGSEKTTVTSRDSPRSEVSPLGRALTMVSAFWARAWELRRTHSNEKTNAILMRMVSCKEGGSERVIGGRTSRLQRSAHARTVSISFDTDFFKLSLRGSKGRRVEGSKGRRVEGSKSRERGSNSNPDGRGGSQAGPEGLRKCAAGRRAGIDVLATSVPSGRRAPCGCVRWFRGGRARL